MHGMNNTACFPELNPLYEIRRKQYEFDPAYIAKCHIVSKVIWYSLLYILLKSQTAQKLDISVIISNILHFV